MSLHDRPTPAEILEAVREYLLEEVAPTADRRARFRALIAANVLAIAERELATAEEDGAAQESGLRALGYAGGGEDSRRRLCAEIRAGRYDEPEDFAAALEFACAMTARKLAVSNPRFDLGEPSVAEVEQR